MEIAEPMQAKSSTESELPSRDMPKMEMLDPSRIAFLKLKDEPQVTKSRIDKLDPIQVVLSCWKDHCAVEFFKPQQK
jgi:hypothetical protein